MHNKIGIIIRREYLERVTKKSFIFTTILMPILMLALMFVPVLIAEYSQPEAMKVVVVDESGSISGQLKSNETFQIVQLNGQWRQMLENDSAQVALLIPQGVENGNLPIQIYTTKPASIQLEHEITSQINSIIEADRLKSYNIDNLDQIIQAVHCDVPVLSRQLIGDDQERESSTMLSYALGIALTFVLYMCLLLYGQMVMTSIIEEKTNRVLEIVVSSIKPAQLMLGKICGIGLVAVTQIIIWMVLTAIMSAFVLPALMPAEMASEMAMVQAGGADLQTMTTDVNLLQALSVIGNVGYIINLFVMLLLYLIGGFMLYAAIYAAIGSAVDNIQDASQMQSIIIFPVIFGMIFGMTAAGDPASTLSMWTSFIPFTSPMVMMARIPHGVPVWETIVSLAILYASFFAMVWVAAKIYRIGIFMYGKKPTLRELIKWISYK